MGTEGFVIRYSGTSNQERREKCTFNVAIIGVVCGNSKPSSQPTWIRMPSLPFRVRLVRKVGILPYRAHRGDKSPMSASSERTPNYSRLPNSQCRQNET